MTRVVRVLAEQPLLGLTVAVTADRRREDLTALLRRRGARVVEAPTLRLVPLEDDAELRAATGECLREPLDYVVATTGRGWRGWISAAEGWGWAEELDRVLHATVVVSRGPKATGAVRASGLREGYSAPSELCSEVRDYLVGQGVAGKRIAVQQYGTTDPGADCDLALELRAAGAHVVAVPVYRWVEPEDRAAVDRLIESIVAREVHAVAFTSAPGVSALLEAAAARDSVFGRDRVLAALREQVAAACVGPVCARPLLEREIPVIQPDRARLGALAAQICRELPERVRREILVEHGRTLIIQGNAVLVQGANEPDAEHPDPDPVLLPPLLAAVLGALAQRPGWVLSRAELLRRVWHPRPLTGTAAVLSPGPQRDQHLVESTIARLRGALGEHGDLIRTVTKRGYRLAAEPTA
ncbi:uroporphyrinogen-III synthase [Actinospica durhamensis]|uniref:Uroporphyrinogen-III synthase n=1 Tax=Actinospica durhamensis TaxID=1508375 RepID=A0A941EV86_9ACTN|nr:uroporphyrinogen-III synthase [Actinospica durhamensis]MBR7837591.1 uroporphyrinogen-III synthase [Actinospica durhamensis]